MTWTGWWPFPGVIPPQTSGQAVEQSGSSPTPAAPAYVVPVKRCQHCHVDLDKNYHRNLCPPCDADEDALLLLDAAYWDLFHVIRYGRLLNHCDEGRVYIRLITDTCRDALAYARNRLDDVA